MNKDITTIETSKEDFNKQVLEKRNETSELSVRLKTEIESGNKLQTLSKVNQDERTRLDKVRKISETMIVNETYKLRCSSKTTSCLKEDITYSTTSKEGFEKKFIQQKDETNNLNVQLNTETELGMKKTMAWIKNQDEIVRANELRELLEARVEEKKRYNIMRE